MKNMFRFFSICFLLFFLSCAAKSSHPAKITSSQSEGLKALVRFTVEDGNGGGVSSLAVLAQKPDLFRVDMLDEVADRIYALGNDGKNVWFWDQAKKKSGRFQASREKMQKYFQLNLSPAQLVSVFFGEVPHDVLSKQFKDTQGRVREARLYKDEQTLVDEKPYLILFFDEHSAEGDRDFPHLIQLSFLEENEVVEMSLEYETFEWTRKIDARLFSLDSIQN
ncbi:MAG: hypothetical protein COX62_05600 [Deltaproteobacteria bacterium CG_4_10_14_0_2_um_filter_43_8]|nr:MAG: hypothetical protein COV43_05115 [Deltaproteobacteria bacterium CG11_big_fil_rev_8_21_14_0_20_42_23]PJA19958.1 MAG: hypothetical protein COX62_05600 [Deltaproteobacteria bacterium CG_4_10_14_0_2_um_filter_43_8]PJC63610.1 MAG: hypothetical protein CO021_08595 [Deltaproteobacteria bacterium CG_4_9_14_0_2_um_filter_42_21]